MRLKFSNSFALHCFALQTCVYRHHLWQTIDMPAAAPKTYISILFTYHAGTQSYTNNIEREKKMKWNEINSTNSGVQCAVMTLKKVTHIHMCLNSCPKFFKNSWVRKFKKKNYFVYWKSMAKSCSDIHNTLYSIHFCKQTQPISFLRSWTWYVCDVNVFTRNALSTPIFTLRT